MATPSARRRTRSPSTATTSTVASSARLSVIAMLLRSARPSPLGEKKRAIRPTSMAGGALLMRCATKKAANVAPTRIRKVIRATIGIALMGLLALVLADDHDCVVVLLLIGGKSCNQCLRGGVQQLDRRVDAERGGDGLG